MHFRASRQVIIDLKTSQLYAKFCMLSSRNTGLAVMAEWQTRQTQNLIMVTLCGFKSHWRQCRPLHQAKAGTYMYRSLIGIPKGSSSDLKSGLDLFLYRDPLPHMTYISSDLRSELVFCFTSYRRYGRRHRPVPGRCMRSRSGSDRGFRRRSVHPDVPRRDASPLPVPR